MTPDLPALSAPSAPPLALPVAPVPVAAPRTLAVNAAHAAELGIDPDALGARPGVLTGNAPWPGAAPVAAAYAGHQFGGFVPQLGDGRAHVLGTLAGPEGPIEIVTKGSGRTPFSRGGDGRAWIGPVLREHLISEAMHALGVPTTRALMSVATGEDVLREAGPLPGAVIARTAPSHLRVGSFQFFAVRGDAGALRTLLEMAAARHHPSAGTPLDLLRAVVDAQARLVARWMSLGFVHGVMNTDNAHIGGLTIDYGPCAFLDAYDPAKVFSSIDLGGRYAYARQPSIAAWNCAQLATALLGLETDKEAAIPDYQRAVDGFAETYQAEWLRLFGAKIGLAGPAPEEAERVGALLDAMARGGLDFTATFRALAEGRPPAGLEAWAPADEAAAERMRAHSPAAIPRNHMVERMIAAATHGDMGPFHEMTLALSNPYADAPEAYRTPPEPGEEVTATFCGT